MEQKFRKSTISMKKLNPLFNNNNGEGLFFFFFFLSNQKRKKEMILTFTNTLSTHSNFPPAFRHLSLFTAIDRSASFFSISSNSDSRWTSSLFIADTSLDNSSVLRRNSFVSDDMVVSIVSPSPSDFSGQKFREIS